MDTRVGKQPRLATISAPERHWLKRYRAGNQAAFEHLMRPHMTSLMGLARRHCRDPHWAEDLIQETLLKAYKGLARFRGDSALRTWLFRILVRLASEPARWQRKMPTQPLSEIDVPDHFDGKQAEQSAIGRELKDRIEEAMERLTERQSTALHLRAVEGMNYASISEVMGCSSAAARMHVLEARNKVLARVKEHLDT